MGASKKGQRTKNVVRKNSLKAKAKGKGKKGSHRSNKKKGKRRTYKKKGGAGSEFKLTPKQKEELEKLGFLENDINNLQDYLNNVGLSIKSETGKEIIDEVVSIFDSYRGELTDEKLIFIKEYTKRIQSALKEASAASNPEKQLATQLAKQKTKRDIARRSNAPTYLDPNAHIKYHHGEEEPR